jgi:hypothetical protein
VLAVAGAVVAVDLLRGEPPLTYGGDTIEQPEQTLTRAEERLRAIVEQRHGAAGDETRCYFSLREGESSDVRDHLRCGPVLFVDGDPREPYLTFPLEVRRGEEADGSTVRLLAADRPEQDQPERLGSDEELRRPDGASPPGGSGGLEPPPPPRAEPGLVQRTPLDGVDWETPEADAVVGSFSAGWELESLAQPDRVGEGDSARRPAEGERFVAARIVVREGQALGLGAPEPPRMVVHVDQAEPIQLQGEMTRPRERHDLLLSVPQDARQVDLVVNDAGVEQRLSLLTGEPGPDNIQVLRREDLEQELDVSGNLTFTLSAPGFVPETSSVTVTVTGASLFWFNADGSQHAPGPDRAWLVLSAEFAWAPELGIGPEYGLDPELWSLRGGGGNMIPAIDLAPEPESFIVGFDVPADFTGSTVVVGGSFVAADGITVDFGGSRLEVPVEFPAG